MGNVWYEPFSDSQKTSSPTGGSSGQNGIDPQCLYGGDCEPILSFASIASGAKYDHCMFEIYDQEDLDKLISKEIIHFNIQNDVINETVLGLEVNDNLYPFNFLESLEFYFINLLLTR